MPHKYPKWLVLEVGVGKPGDMRRTAAWLKTDAVIITAIGETPAHIEFFNSRRNLVEEKSGLIKTLKKDGLLILNGDDETVLSMKTNSKHRTITFGFKEGNDILGSDDSIFYDEALIPIGINFKMGAGGNSLPVVIEGVFGRNHVYACLAALALSSGLKINMISAINALKNYEVAPGRMRLLRGINGTLVIDDTHNSSPYASEFALRTLGTVKSEGRKIAILGDMLELGRHTEEAHKNIGTIAAEILSKKSGRSSGVLIVVGQRAKAIKEGALFAGMKEKNISEFLDSHDAAKFMKTFIEEKDLILVKGSQGMRMERVVEAILRDQENKQKLLVRQDDEWQRKK